jgi:ribosomal protein S4
MQKLIDFFLIKKQQRERIYFRKPFIYEPRVPFIYIKKFKIKKQLIGVQVIKLFYVMYNFKQLSNIAKKAKKQSGVFEQNFLTIIEAKLPSFLYRTSIFSTLFESIKFVKQNNV